MRTPHLTIIGVTLLLVSAGGCTPSGDSGAGTGGVLGSGGQVASSGGSGPSGSGGGVTSSGGAGPSGGSGGAVVPASGGSPGSGGASSSGSGGRTASGGTGGTGDGGSGTNGAAGNGGGGHAPVGGAHGGDAGGAGQGGRAGGGAGQAGSGGGGGASSQDPRAAAQELDGFALLKPCFAPPSGCCCDENSAALLNTGMAPENQHLMKQFGGNASATYNVKLRVVGVAERYWYTGGMLDPMSKIFYTGGLPTIHSAQAPNDNLSPGQGACKIHPPQTDKDYPIPFTVPPEVAPADSCYNGFNIFAMTVSSPKQTYYLNYTTDYDNVDRQPHSVYKTDYTVTIPIAGQAKIDFYVLDGDHHQVANTNMSVPNLKNTTIKQPYSGNFLELEVVDVTRGN